MTTHYHAVIWIDHHEAHVLHFNADESDVDIIHATHSPGHFHSKAGSPSGMHVRDEPEFYRKRAGAPALGVDGSGYLDTFAGDATSGAFFGTPGAVPEPASLALLGAALAGLGSLRRRQKAA